MHGPPGAGAALGSRRIAFPRVNYLTLYSSIELDGHSVVTKGLVKTCLSVFCLCLRKYRVTLVTWPLWVQLQDNNREKLVEVVLPLAAG